MGGSIAIAARYADGETVCVDGWTNFIPRMVVNPVTLSGDDGIVREMLTEVAGHASYAGPQPFRAQGYGMVAIDFVAREIHSMQGYTSFATRTLNQLVDLNASGWQGGEFVNVLSDEGGGLLDAGRITLVARDGVECEPETLDRTRTLELLSRDLRSFLAGQGMAWLDIRVDTDPFAVHDYPEGGSLAAMKERLRAAGFPLTRADGLNASLPRRSV